MLTVVVVVLEACVAAVAWTGGHQGAPEVQEDFEEAEVETAVVASAVAGAWTGVDLADGAGVDLPWTTCVEGVGEWDRQGRWT